jgi:hypothetical protein
VPSQPPPPTLYNKSATFVAVTWEAVGGAKRYELQVRSEEGRWDTVSDSIATHMSRYAPIRKPKAKAKGYEFRVRAANDNGWGVFSMPSIPLTCLAAAARARTDAAVLDDAPPSVI